ncbi:secreted protein [Streptomyces iranensis]|uniref:Secreted protein n=1 Tax=Streptomyces iranensis TaxID=576784 RepID=A0A061A325_9ACTN|nr:secreted protein [Streptomyces iranensis]
MAPVRTGAARVPRTRAARVRYASSAPVPRARAAQARRADAAPPTHAQAASPPHAPAATAPRADAASVPHIRARFAWCGRAARLLLSAAALALPVVALALPVVALFPMLGAAPAQAADGYRYWSFWQRGGDGGSWSYATQGPSSARPGDGDMIGFRFAVSEDSDDATRPRGMADFAAACADTPATDGTKRVAVVIDFGTATDAPDRRTPPAPRTECARVGEDASAGEALAAVAKPLRYNSAALLCAVSGYPETGCGDKVSTSVDAHAAPKGDGGKADDGGSGPSAGLIGGLAAVVLLGAAAVWQARRRRG